MGAGRPPIMNPCPHCGEPFKSSDYASHVRKCPKNPANQDRKAL
jgi:uncharacterized C2H2 Zn-finger protein